MNVYRELQKQVKKKLLSLYFHDLFTYLFHPIVMCVNKAMLPPWSFPDAFFLYSAQ